MEKSSRYRIFLIFLMVFIFFIGINLFFYTRDLEKENDIVEKKLDVDKEEDQTKLITEIIDLESKDEEVIKKEKEITIITSGDEGFYIFDNTNHEIIDLINTGSFVNDAIIKNNIIYIADRQGIKIFEYNEILNEIQLVNQFNTFGNSLSISLYDNYLYLADGNNGFVIFEIKDNIFLRLYKHINLRGIVTKVERYYNYIFIKGSNLGLRIYEIFENEIIEHSIIDEFILINDLKIVDDYLYINDFIKGLYKYNLKDFLYKEKLFPIEIFELDIQSFYPVGENIYFSNNKGIFLFYKNNITQLLEGNFQRATLFVDDLYLYISRKVEGLTKFDLSKNTITYEYNRFNFVNSFKKFDNISLIEDRNYLYILNNDFEIQEKIFIENHFHKGINYAFLINDNNIIMIGNDYINYLEYLEPLRNIKETRNQILLIHQNSVKNINQEIIIEINNIDDLEIFNSRYIILKDGNLYKLDNEYNKISLNINENIRKIYTNEKYLIALNSNKILFIDKNYYLDFYLDLSSFPSNILVLEDKVILSQKNTINIIDIKNQKYQKNIFFASPVVDIDFNNYLYVSFSSLGLKWFEIEDNFYTEVGYLNTFNANNFHK